MHSTIINFWPHFFEIFPSRRIIATAKLGITYIIIRGKIMPTMPTTVPMSGCGNIGQKWKGKRRAERGNPRERIRKWKQRYSRKIIHLLCFLFPNCSLFIVHFFIVFCHSERAIATEESSVAYLLSKLTSNLCGVPLFIVHFLIVHCTLSLRNQASLFS